MFALLRVELHSVSLREIQFIRIGCMNNEITAEAGCLNNAVRLNSRAVIIKLK